MSTEPKDESEKAPEKPHRRKSDKRKIPSINITIDKSMITALLALFGTAGVGWYNSADSNTNIETTKAGVEIQVNEAQQQHADRLKKLAKVIKAQNEELAELRETMDWLLVSMDEFGSKTNKPVWLRVKKRAPDHVDFDIGDSGELEVEVDEDSIAEPSLGHGAGTGTGAGFGTGGVTEVEVDTDLTDEAPPPPPPEPVASPIRVMARKVKKKAVDVLNELENQQSQTAFPDDAQIDAYQRSKETPSPQP